MSADKLNEDKFDDMLGRSLRRHIEPVPDNFTARMLERVKGSEQQKILARVVMQERLALGGCIAMAVAVIVMAVVFPDVARVFVEKAGVFIERAGEAAEVMRGQWQFFAVLAGVMGFAAYNLVRTFVSDS